MLVTPLVHSLGHGAHLFVPEDEVVGYELALECIIVAVCQCQGWGDRDRRANTGVFHTNVNTSNQFSYGTDGEYHTAADGSPPYSFGVTTHYIIDTPGSTSRTYKIGLRSEDGSNVGVQGDSSYDRSYIILQEITA